MKGITKLTVVLVISSLSWLLSGCPARESYRDNNSRYVVAVNQNAGISPRSAKAHQIPTVGVPFEPVTSLNKGSNRSGKKLVGEEAINQANQKSVKRASSGAYLNSIMNFDYDDGAIYQIYTAPLNITDVQFQENEHIVAVAAGDTTRWKMTKTYSGMGAEKKEHLLVKPIEEGLKNGVVVTTDVRTYHLNLESTAGTYMASVTWRYPDDDGIMVSDGEDDEGALEEDPTASIDINNMSFNYRVVLAKGKVKPDWFPKMVFNDGKKTYIKFSSQAQDAPSLFVIEDNLGQVVNYRVRGNYYIIDRVIHQAQLHGGPQNRPVIVQIVAMNKRS